MNAHPYRRKTIQRIALLAIAAFATTPAWSSAIQQTTGQVKVVGMYTSVAPAAAEDDALAAVMLEHADAALSADLTVDALLPGTYNSPTSLHPSTILAGTIVSDVYLYADPVRSTGTRFIGSITFGSDILGVISSSANLTASDGALGLAGVLYPGDDVDRGFEVNQIHDQFTISADRRTLSFSSLVGANIDSLRIVTASSAVLTLPAAVTVTPEPSTYMLMISGFVGCALLRRTKRSSL